MRKLVFSTMLTTLALTAPAAAQLEGIYIPPQCEIDTGHFLARQAQQYVKAASEAREPEERERAIQDAYRTLNDAIERGEEGNGAVWYFFARTYVLDEDFAGADSAIARADALLPECAEDTESLRYNMWVPVYNEAVMALRANDYAAAKPFLMDANAIYHKEPNVPFYLAQIYAQDGSTDSGLVFFKKTMNILNEVADTSYGDMYDVAVFNTARLFHQAQEWDSAATWYAAYQELHPEDMVSLQALAGVYEFAGRNEEAIATYRNVVARADELEAQMLFQTGVSLFTQEEYELASEAFEAGLRQNGYFRDGWYNLGQSYFALANPVDAEGVEPTAEQMAARTEWAQRMLEAAVELEKVDPMNVASLQMLVQAFHLLGEEDSTASVIDRLNAMDYELVVTYFQDFDGGFEVGGQIVNNREEEIAFPGMTMNWINAAGETVATDVIPGKTMAPQEELEWRFSPTGEGLVAWTYAPVGGN